MRKRFKNVLLIVSLFINFTVVILGGILIQQKGGIDYLQAKLFGNGTILMESVTPTYFQRKSLFEMMPINNDDIVFIGDSITQRNEWSELFNNYNLKNRGIDLDTTSNIINRLDGIISGQPIKIFLMVGINDMQQGISADKVLENYTIILDTIKEKSPSTETYIQSILPVDAEINTALVMTNKDIILMNGKIENLVKSYDNYKFIDLFPVFIDDDNKLNKDLTKDGVHLTGEGYMVWKQEIINYVNTQ